MKAMGRLAGAAVMAALWLPTIWGPAQTRGGESATEDLRSLMTAALSAAQQKDEAKLKEIAHAMMIPSYETWFRATFGEDEGGRMAAVYKADLEQQEERLPQLFKGLSEHEGEWLIEAMTEPRIPGENRCEQALLKASKNGIAFYSATLQTVLIEGNKAYISAGYFVLVNGRYRRFDCIGSGLGTSGGIATGHTALGPLRVSGNLVAKRIISRVQPVYPKEALKQRISGTVRLHVLIAKDGTVEQVEVASGHPLLQRAAVDAVLQWRYQPTLLDGEPVEVDTTVDLIFSLNNPPSPSP
jgi:protein TonB